MAFTTDTPETVFEAESSTTSEPLPTTASPTSTSPTSPITEAPTPLNTLDSQTDSNTTNDSGPGSNLGIIVGGAIGGLAVVCGSILAAVWLFHRSRREKVPKAASSDSSSSDGSPYFTKAELAADSSQRQELMGQSRSELSAKGPASYDPSAYRPASYNPKSPVELPAGNWL
jgi:hypothetical protein